MPAAFVQSKSGSSTAGTGTWSLAAFTSATTAGNLIVVAAADDSAVSGNVTSVTDNKGNTYTKIVDNINATDTSLWYSLITTGGTGHTITINFNSSFATNSAAVAQEFSGILSSPLDKSANNTGISTTPSSGATAATTQADELVVGATGWPTNTNTASLGSGYSNLDQAGDVGVNIAMESKVVSAIGAQTATFTLSGSNNWVAIVATFKGTSSATPVVTAWLIA